MVSRLYFGKKVLVHAQLARIVGSWVRGRSTRKWERQACPVFEAVYLGEGWVFNGHCRRDDEARTRWVAESGFKAVRVAVPGPRIVYVPKDGYRLWTWSRTTTNATEQKQISLFEESR